MCNEKSSLSTPLRLAEAEEDLVVPAYFRAYRSLRLTRDALGVLVAEFHSNGSPLTFTYRAGPYGLCRGLLLTTARDAVAKIRALIFFIMFPCTGLIGRWQMIFHQGTIVPGQPDSELQRPRAGNGDVSQSITRNALYRQLLLWAGTNPQFDKPFLDIGADHIWMVFLQVVKARTKLHQSAVL